MSLSAESVCEALNRNNAQWQVTEEEGALRVPAEHLLAVCEWLAASEDYQFDYLANLTAVDFPPESLDVVYHLFSIAKKIGPLCLKVRLPRVGTQVDSVVPVWRGAEYQEREVYDLYGVEFTGHPDMRRILMWEDFEGAPMRKDYVDEDQDELD